MIGRFLPTRTEGVDDSLGGGRLVNSVYSKNKLCSWLLPVLYVGVSVGTVNK